MKLKELHSLMQDIAPFDSPKVELEQYPTGPHLASRLLYTVHNSYDEFDGRVVIDLGCGTGMLAIGAAMLGSSHVLGLDIDPDALATAQANVDQFEGLAIDFVMCDVLRLAGSSGQQPQVQHAPPRRQRQGQQPGRRQRGGRGRQRGPRRTNPDHDEDDPAHNQQDQGEAGDDDDEQNEQDDEEEDKEENEEDEEAGGVQEAPVVQALVADTVVMNPPFGTRRKGADMDFLRAAFRLSRHSVYSLHKSSTRAHIEKVAKKELGAASAEVLAELRYDLPATYKFHKQKSVDVQVDLWRFQVGNGS